MRTKPKELDLARVEKNLLEQVRENGRGEVYEEMKHVQTTLYIMCGGGWLGDTAAHHPDVFHIDGRSGALPYSKADIFQVLAVFKVYLRVLGYEKPPRRVMPHSCGVF